MESVVAKVYALLLCAIAFSFRCGWESSALYPFLIGNVYPWELGKFCFYFCVWVFNIFHSLSPFLFLL